MYVPICLIPTYIVLGHELIHTSRAITGHNNYTEWGYEPNFGIGRLVEEYETVGMNYFDEYNNPIKCFDPNGMSLTENSLRLENKLNIRISMLGDFPR